MALIYMYIRFNKSLIIALISIIFVICVIYVIFFSKKTYKYFKVVKKKDIEELTDEWIKEVTENHDPEAIYQLFCPDGNLVGTASQVKRKGRDIKAYFEYFAKLQGIHVISKQYNISHVSKDVYLNTAFITWKWDSIDEPVTARMTFLYKNRCIFQLHSSVLPEINKSLLKISNLN